MGGGGGGYPALADAPPPPPPEVIATSLTEMAKESKCIMGYTQQND